MYSPDGGVGVQFDTRIHRDLQHAINEFGRMISAVAGNEASDESALEAELLTDLHPRPDFYLLVLPAGHRHFVADGLLLAFGVGKVQPALRREIAVQLFLLDDLLEPVSIAHRE